MYVHSTTHSFPLSHDPSSCPGTLYGGHASRSRERNWCAISLGKREGRLDSKEEEKVSARLKIKDLEYGSPPPGCIERNHQDILKKIGDRTVDLDAPNTLRLKGHPGVEKSAIATKRG
jgi:hypothetical protein